MYPASIQIVEKERMYPASVDEQPKHAYGLHGYPQPAVTVGLPANNAHNDTNNYPQIPPPPQQMEETNRWTTGLCNCCEDCCSCWLTYFCPCIAFGQIAEIIDKGSTSCGISGCIYAMILHFLGCPCLYSFSYRTKLRAKFNLKEDPCGDCLVHCFCESCALCQEYRELKKRGFDPALGWVGYLEKQERTAAAQARTPHENIKKHKNAKVQETSWEKTWAEIKE